MKKPRSDSKLLTMPAKHKSQLAQWLLSGMPYHRALPLVKKEFGVKTSISALGTFWETYCGPELIRQRARAVKTAAQIAKEAAANPGQFDVATIDALKQKAFEMSISPGADPKAVKQLFSLVLQARGQDLDEKELELARDKFQFDAAKAALAAVGKLKAISTNSKLSASQKIDAVRKQLFGVATK